MALINPLAQSRTPCSNNMDIAWDVLKAENSALLVLVSFGGGD